MVEWEDVVGETTIAVVFELNGDGYYRCESEYDIDRARAEIREAGGEPVVFDRRTNLPKPKVTNTVIGNVTGSFVQCERVDGGVRF
jgi:hypothetical protein